MGADGPQIETERLRLRRHRLTDLDARAAMTSNSTTMAFVGGPQDYEENFNRLLRYAGHWALLNHGVFLIEERAGGGFVGEAGLAYFRRGLGPDFDGFPEAAWMIAASAVGQGYATEAITAAIAWYEQNFGRGRKVCIIDPGNGPSLRVAAKLGFRPFRDAVFKDRPVILHERLPTPPQAG
ncbi:GNAT family N-acetyltransferase [Sphingomonas crusticola]|uniref:GNAT family N-acetyltransferase n=1 Tax=Sphingomonas crusticola TaxID=1697973 RepID=UPI001F07A858|nr:GNAT family protein [Sphingomonas crusticola]